MSKILNKRLENEFNDLIKNPVANCSAGPIDNKDMTLWIATITGPEGTPYHNGIFNLKIHFTNEYESIMNIVITTKYNNPDPDFLTIVCPSEKEQNNNIINNIVCLMFSFFIFSFYCESQN